jgi:hypothetical protein
MAFGALKKLFLPSVCSQTGSRNEKEGIKFWISIDEAEFK